MPDLCVYANRFTPRVKKGEFPTLSDVDRYEKEIEKRWNLLEQELTAASYKKTTKMPIKGIDYRSMGVYVERGEMSPDDPFTGYYGVIRFWEGQRVEKFEITRQAASKTSARRGPAVDMARYTQEEEVLLITDDLELAARTHHIMLDKLPDYVVAGDLARIRLNGFVNHMINGHEVPVLESVIDLNPMVMNKSKPLIQRVYGEGGSELGNGGVDFLTGRNNN
ncbi:MAG: hypothetical protein HYT71_03005 [Candidatus Aenigmarchaeota archaeon]|nr:hypothetical protein [Candidatus Aenigmarchaeota archaeon]